jgi:hypothetical protein
MMKKLTTAGFWAMGGAMLIVAVGCNSPAGMAVQLVGKAVDTVDTDKLGKELKGKRASAADAKFGGTIDVYKKVGSLESWRVYPVPMDVLGNMRYVVQMSGMGTIVGVTKVKIDGSGIELAQKLMLDQKVQGKTPSECQKALGMGAPLLTVRSETTGLMTQLYDASLIKGIGSHKYARLRFDASNRCTEVSMVDVSASTEKNPTN